MHFCLGLAYSRQIQASLRYSPFTISKMQQQMDLLKAGRFGPCSASQRLESKQQTFGLLGFLWLWEDQSDCSVRSRQGGNTLLRSVALEGA